MENPDSARFQHLLAALEADSAIAAVYLSGSHAKGTATRLSDIGIALLLHSSVDESRYFALRLEYLSRVMEMLRTERVEVVVLNSAPLHLAYEIVSRGTLLLDRNPRYRAAFEADSVGRFLDFKPFPAVQPGAIKEHLKRGTFFDRSCPCWKAPQETARVRRPVAKAAWPAA
jgi:hypothetical protein